MHRRAPADASGSVQKMIATLLSRSEHVAQQNLGSVFFGSIACFIIAAVWAICFRVFFAKGRNLKLPHLWWCFVGSAVALFVLFIVGTVLVNRAMLERNRLELERSRRRVDHDIFQFADPVGMKRGLTNQSSKRTQTSGTV